MHVNGRGMSEHDSLILETINILIKVAITIQKYLQYLQLSYYFYISSFTYEVIFVAKFFFLH